MCPRLGWSKADRILKNDDFKRVFINGKKAFGKIFRIYVLANQKTQTVFGITITKKIKKAVTRNYYKRVIREILRTCKADILPGWEAVINVPGIPTPGVDFYEMQTELLGLLKKSRLLIHHEK